jgi:DNA repair exonuclease SbcCD ATPase subunit
MAKSPDHDDEIAALYRLPLGEFTAARNALAKKLGPAAGDVRTLEKPNVAAWAVNQLYWQRRPAYDALIRAAQAMRTAHTHMLSGRKADVPQADSAHRDAIRAATQAIRELAQAAGETLSASTLEAVGETLRSLPSDDAPGRLTKPLSPLGFGALLGISVQGPVSRVQGPGPGAGVPGSRSPGVAKSTVAERAAAKKEAAENAKKRKELEKALRAAEAAERDAESALAEARKAVAKVERDYAAVRDRLQFLEKQRTDAEEEAHKRSRALTEATNARTQAAQELQRFT